MAVRIVTDSASDLPLDLAKQWDITVVPAYIIIDDKPHRGGVDITADEFYQKLEAGGPLPTTAQPSVADFTAAYRELLGAGHDVVSMHVSGKLSGTVNSAEQARAGLGEEAAGRIEVVDSELASIPLGLMALAAAQQAADASSHSQVAEQARQRISRYHGLFLLDTLTYLQKGGRIGKAQAFVGSMLNVKPILTIQDGVVHPVERVRNRRRALPRLVEMAEQLAPLEQLAVVYSTQPEEAQSLKARLSALVPIDDIVVARFGPALGTYVGPGGLGVALARAGDMPNS